MTSPLAQAFAQGPGWLPQQLEPATDRVLLAAMTEDDYRSASFLDQRMLTAQNRPQWAQWSELAEAGRRDADFIFHIGHVGSTLISRLLQELPGILPVREPQILRNFADLELQRGRPDSPWSPEQFDDRLETALGWLSRTFDPGQRAMIKATSFVGEIAPMLIAGGQRALLLGLSAESYVAAILSGENSRAELAMLAPSRLNRLHRRIGEERWRLWELAEGERAAMAWLVETMALEAAEKAAADGLVLRQDFDAFLADPASGLAAIAAFFDLETDQAAIGKIVDGPVMNRYSKAPEHGFDASQRRALLDETRQRHAEEIAAAMRWLDEAAARYDGVATTLANQVETH